ncbi:Mov34/MPN/PAD-1 family protein [Sphingomonas japonica]|uniref:Proteasome lid subunit RPN8/RPN11 n=1 Tax=Sphingomonas japonica TaxID=511662 RepID=A0ABX0U2C6_9SPHN|nr:M67 family metallopeptidase [Sphingomonas japonica]NIJ24728.1 proteasome lid subunit RPN8/RPN11 [Sphingomonas japonica]
MILRVSSRALHCVITEASIDGQRESCGLLWGTSDRIVAAQTADNVSPSPRTAFEIDPRRVIAAHRRARRMKHLALVGHWHSHPRGEPVPSPRDADAAMSDGSLWLIVAGDVARLWRAVKGGRVHDRFDPVPFAIGRDIRVDKVGTGVRMHRSGPDGGPPLLESIA